MTNTPQFYINVIPALAKARLFDGCAWNVLNLELDGRRGSVVYGELIEGLYFIGLPMLGSIDLIHEVLSCLGSGDASGVMDSLKLLHELGIVGMPDEVRAEIDYPMGSRS